MAVSQVTICALQRQLEKKYLGELASFYGGHINIKHDISVKNGPSARSVNFKNVRLQNENLDVFLSTPIVQ